MKFKLDSKNQALGPFEQFTILRWYYKNPYFKNSEEQVNEAVTCYNWCKATSDHLDYQRDGKEALIKTGMERFNKSHSEISSLLRSVDKLSGLIKNKLILAIEGIDGAGKTMQANLLKKKIEDTGKSCKIVSFPNYEGFFGEHIGQLLAGQKVHSAKTVDAQSMALWYAADRWSRKNEIIDAKEDVVILNRYTLSSVIYQSLRMDCKHEYNIADWIFDLEHVQFGLPVPDRYFILDITPQRASVNNDKKGDRIYVDSEPDVYEKDISFLINAREKYIDISNHLPFIDVIPCMENRNKMKAPSTIAEIIFEKV